MRLRTSAIILAAGACAVTANTAMAQSTVYAIDLRATPNRLLTFPSNAPALNVVSSNAGYDGFAIDFDASATTLYGIVSTSNIFGTIDTTTGNHTAIGPITGDAANETSFTGLSADPNGTMYLSSGTNLYTIDVTTGNTTLVGAFGAGASLNIDIAIDSQGNMYGHDIGADTLVSIDKTTGVATVIGPTGFAANFAQGMDFDWATDTLYATVYTGGGTGAYVEFDLTTGAGNTILDTTPWNAEMEMAIASPIPEPASLAVLGLGGLGLLRRRRVNA